MDQKEDKEERDPDIYGGGNRTKQVERLRNVKDEEVYLKGHRSIAEAWRELGIYFEFYNRRRWHQGLDNRIPDVVYWASRQRSQVAA